MFAEIGPDFVKVEQVLTAPGRIVAEFGQAQAGFVEIGPELTEAGQIVSRFESMLGFVANVGRIWPMWGQTVIEIGRWPNFAATLAEFGRTWSISKKYRRRYVVQSRPNMDRTWPHEGRKMSNTIVLNPSVLLAFSQNIGRIFVRAKLISMFRPTSVEIGATLGMSGPMSPILVEVVSPTWACVALIRRGRHVLAGGRNWARVPRPKPTV